MDDAFAYKPIVGVTPTAKVGADLDDTAKLTSFIRDLMASSILKTNAAAGAVVSIVKNGRILLVWGDGYADAEAQNPVVPERTLFRIGSMSKLFTATAVMQLVESKRLSLEADVNGYLGPDLQIPRSTFRQPVTLKNLLTHTAGFEENQLGYMVKKNVADLVPLEQNLREHMPRRVRQPTTDFTDGHRAAYSSWGIALAGHIVSRASGLAFDDYVDQQIFGPLGMKRSTFREPLPKDWAPDLSKGHLPRSDGTFAPQGFEYFHSIGPAGSVTTTAGDMGRFMLAHLEGRIPGGIALDTMHHRVLSPHPNVNGSGIGFYELHLNGRRMLSHRGNTVFFPSKLVLLPQEKVGMYIALNSPTPASVIRAFLRGFLDEYFPADIPGPTQTPTKLPARQYAGRYFATPHSHSRPEKALLLVNRQELEMKVTVGEDGNLRLPNLVEGHDNWTQVSPGVFQQPESQEVVAFVDGDRGKGRHIVGPMAFAAAYRLRFYEIPSFHVWLQWIALGIFAAAIAWLLGDWLFNRCGEPGPRVALGLAAALGAINFLALRSMLKVFLDPLSLLYGYPPAFKCASKRGLLTIPMTAGVICFAAAAWHFDYWTLTGQLAYTAVAAAAIAFLWSLYHWNLLTFKDRT